MKKRESCVPLSRIRPARLFRIHPEPGLPFVVELRISRNREHMHREVLRVEGQAAKDGLDKECQGLVRSWVVRRTNRTEPLQRGVLARMFLNAADVKGTGTELIAHECGHAAMAYARFRRAQLNVMDGEEVMCYALGRLNRQVSAICYHAGVFDGRFV